MRYQLSRYGLVIGFAGALFISTGISLAGDKPAVTPTVPVLKKDSGHAAPDPATKQTMPNHNSPPLPKPGLPVDAGKPRGTAAIGGATSTIGHKDGMLNGTQMKRHP